MAPEIIITRAEEADADRLLELQKAAFLSEAKLYNDFEIAPLKENKAAFIKSLKSHIILKATLDGEIVGSIRVRESGDICHIGRLFVSSEYQNQGIGRSLLLEAEKYCREAGEFLLFTGPKSEKNIGLYESCGYRQTGKFIPDANTGMNLVEMAKKR